MIPTASPERIDKHRAAVILGCAPRAVVSMAAAGKLASAGAAKLCREWTFDEKRLRAYVREKEAEACQAAAAKEDPPPPVAIGAAIPCGAASLSAGRSTADHLIQTMRKLQKAVAQPSRPGC